MATLASDGGRRSRRGYAYQDLLTLLDCLDLSLGLCDEVGFEELEDIVRVVNGATTYKQVKTSENGNRHSIATVCSPELKNKPETSILGRLFNKPSIQPVDRFALSLNETPSAGLGAFVVARGATRGAVDEKYRRDIEKRLEGLELESGRSVAWCVERLDVQVEARTVDQVEDVIIRALAPLVSNALGDSPLFAELEEVLGRLAREIGRDAMAIEAKRWRRDEMVEALQRAVTGATGRRPNGEDLPLEPLVSKLRAAGVPKAEALKHTDAMLAYRRSYRSAIGLNRRALDELNDHVFAICSAIQAGRRAGDITPGPKAYARTIAALSKEPLVLATVEFSLAQRLAALSDVTARCQNRYSDD